MEAKDKEILKKLKKIIKQNQLLSNKNSMQKNVKGQ